MRGGHRVRAAADGDPKDDLLVPELPGRAAMRDIDVRCGEADAGWRCGVTVRDGRGSSTHEVTVGTEDAARLAAATDQAEVERLLYETFDFLLDREPKESILSSFDISVVRRYFPEYEHEIQSRLAP
jgi:hypothetical protein